MGIREMFSYGAATDKGRQRDNNEDRYRVIDGTDGPYDVEALGAMFVVADGMGGHVGGEKASAMACDGVALRYYDPAAHGHGEGEQRPHDSAIDSLARAVDAVNREILDYSRDYPEYQGMGTTLSLLLLRPGTGVMVHVGDSRIYRLRESEFTQLTTDHTEVQALVDMGRLKPERVRAHPWRHMLTQAVGVDAALEEMFVAETDLAAGDVYLLCSDGLHDMVEDEAIRQILLADGISPQKAADNLVRAALDQGGEDNVTVIVVKIAAPATRPFAPAENHRPTPEHRHYKLSPGSVEGEAPPIDNAVERSK